MPAWASRVRSVMRRWLHAQKVEEELAEEVQAYFDTMIERGMARGLSRDAAQREARLRFGGAGAVNESVREARMGVAIETTLHDVRFACRVLRKNPGFAAVAVLSLGLGLGANTAIFSLVNEVMLKSLPMADAGRLYFIDNSGGKEGGGNAPPYPCYERLRDGNHSFSGMAAFSAERFKTAIDGAQEEIRGQFASGSYFQVLGVNAVMGRVLTPADDSIVGSGGPDGAVAVISYALWDKRFGRSPAVLGKPIRVAENWVRIVGVTPPGFRGLSVGSPVDVTIPMMLTTNNLRSRGSWWFSAVGRLKDGVRPEAARAELDGYFQNYMDEMGIKGEIRKFFNGIALMPAAKGLEGLRRKMSKPLLIVMAIVGLLLLTGCANVANLLLARANARRDEIALRLAIGASRGRLIRQLFTEGLLLTGVAAGVGLVFARWCATSLASMFAGIRGRIVLEPAFDWRVAAFTAGVSLLTGLMFSLMPAIHATRTDAAKPGSGRGSGGTRGFGGGNLLVVAQVTLTVVLVCGAALFLRSLRNLTQLDAGFQREGVLTMHVAATLPKTASKGKAAEEEHARIGRMWNALLEPLHALPQVRTASVSTLSPMSGRRRGVLLDVSGAPPVAERDRGISINQVSAGYFETLGVKLSAGRLFTEADQANSAKVAILNETAAKARFRDASPLGRRVTLPGQRITAEYEVVGIVKDTRYADLRKPAEPMVYLPLEQAIDPLSGVTVAIRARGDATGLAALVRRRAQETVPGGFLTDIATVQQQVDETLVEERMISMLASLFGGLALLLAAIGLYGIVSFSVIRRTREIGIRISIGAQRSSVLWMILRGTLQFVAIGVALGIPLVLLTKRYIDSELFGLQGGDPVAIAATILLLACVALGAGAWPAWRASRLDPMTSLRQE